MSSDAATAARCCGKELRSTSLRCLCDAPVSSTRWSIFGAIIAISIAVPLLAATSYNGRIPITLELWHGVFQQSTSSQPTLGLCFMTGSDVFFPALWTAWLTEAMQGRKAVTIVHRASDDIRTSALPGAVVIPAIKGGAWGKWLMLEIQQALLEECVTRGAHICLLLSGDSLPVRPFDSVYDEFLGEGVERSGRLSVTQNTIVHLKRESSLNRSAWPGHWTWTFSTASQWCALLPRHIHMLRRNFDVLTNVFRSSRIPDEHVYVMFFNGTGALGTSIQAKPFMHVTWQWTKETASINEEIKKMPKPCHKPDRLPITHHGGAELRAACGQAQTEGALFIRKKLHPGSPVQFQWDPARHLTEPSPDGREPRRALRARAIQIGLRGRLSEDYVASITSISDVTSLARAVGAAHTAAGMRGGAGATVCAAAMAALAPDLPNERPYSPNCDAATLAALRISASPAAAGSR